jgi:hypothetical protein
MADYRTLGKHVLSSLLLTFLILTLFQVLMAQVFQMTLVAAADGNTALTTIVFLGFLLAWVVPLVVNLLTSDAYPRRVVFYASLFSMWFTAVIWISIAALSILRAYPGIVVSPAIDPLFFEIVVRGVYHIAAIPRLLAYYAIYSVGNITRFWIYVALTNAPIYAFFLNDLATPKWQRVLRNARRRM